MSIRKLSCLSIGKIVCVFFSFVFLLLSCQPVFAQRRGSEREKKKKFHPIDIRTLDDTLVPTLVNKVASYTFTIDRDNFLLNHSYDLLPIEETLPDIESKIKEFRSIFERVGQNMNIQGLSTSTIILKDVATRLSSYKTILQGFKTSVLESNQKVQKIINDSALTDVVTDSALSNEMGSVISEGSELDTAQKLLLARINLLNSRVSVNQFETNDLISDMLYLSITKKINLFLPEKDPLFQATKNQYNQSTKKVVQQGLMVSGKVIPIYLARRINLLVLAFLFFVLIFIWCKLNIHHILRRKDASEVMKQVVLLKRSLITGCLLAL
ncbi:MAG: hypothetical protein ACRDE2_17165, partial [Chitinophagaceae bacterium]